MRQSGEKNKARLFFLFLALSFIASPNVAYLQPSSGTGDLPPFQSQTPQNLEVYEVDFDRVTLRWDAVVGGWITAGYSIYRCDGSGCIPITKIGEATPPFDFPSYIDEAGLVAGQTYGYSVTAYNDLAPDSESVKAPTVYVTTPLLPTPRSLASSSPSSTRIDLSWDPVDYQGLSGYKIYRCSEFQGCNPTELIGTTDAVTAVYSDTNLTPGGYMYAVSSYSGPDESAKSMALSSHTRQPYSASDFSTLVSNWLRTGPGIVSDVNGDEVVNTVDIGIMMNSWSDL